MKKTKFLRSVKDGSETAKAKGAANVEAAAANRQRYLGTLPAGKMGRRVGKNGEYTDTK